MLQEPLSIYEEQVIHLLIHVAETFYSSSSRSSILILNGSASSFLFELLGYMADVKGNTVMIIFYDNDDTVLLIMYIRYHLYCAPDQYYAQKSPSPLRLRSWPRCIKACEWNSTFFWMQETRYDQPGQRGPSDICVIEGARVFQLNAMCFFSVAWTLANCKALESQFHMVENFQIFELQYCKPWSIRKLPH